MSNSPLVKYTKLSPNHSGKRTHVIDTITIHCVVGHASLASLGAWFGTSSRQSSCNYAVDDNGDVGMYVEEANRSWCSGGYDKNRKPIMVNGISGSMNDQRAVTIEVASDTKDPYKVTDKALQGVIRLCADICKRNGIKKLLWEGNKALVGKIDRQNMTVHRWFAYKACPGDYLYNKHGYIADEVNKILGTSQTKEPEKETPVVNVPDVKENDVVVVAKNSVYYGTSRKIPTWVVNKKWIVSSVKGDRAIINKSQDGKNSINSPIDTRFLTVVGTENKTSAFKPYIAIINATTVDIRKEPSANSQRTGTVSKNSAYTIVAEQNGFGKLKSGAGWVALSNIRFVRNI